MTDGAGGALFCTTFGNSHRIGRVTDSGTVSWTTEVNNFSGADAFSICPDGAGGVWWVLGHFNGIRRGRVTVSGAIGVPSDGSASALAVGSECGNCVADGAGGAWFSMIGASGNVYLVRFNSVGANVATLGGLLLVGTTSDKPRVISDGAGGAIAVCRVGSTTDLRGFRANAANALVWASGGISLRTGVAVSGGASDLAFSKICTDGGRGVVCHWQDDRPSANPNDIYGQRLTAAAGAASWLANGLPISTLTAEQRPLALKFDGVATPSDYPAAASPGYHVWAGLEGFKDAVKVDGSGGVTRAFRIETPDSDDMQEDVEKDYDRATLFVKSGVASLNVGLVVDEGAVSVAVAVPVFSTGKRWGAAASPPTANTLYWGQGNWGGNRAREFIASFPAGTIGKKARLTLSADLDDDLVLSGATIDYEALPDRGY
jgi:hypothetical protein